MKNTENNRERLIELVGERSFLKSDEPIFKLSSGKMSNVYFDLRRVTLSPEGQYLIGNLFMDMIETLDFKPQAIGGLTMGADPVSTAVAAASWQRSNPIEAFVIRKEPKQYGTGRQIEGVVEPGDPVIVVDDVLTTGKSTNMAIDIARGEGLDVRAAIVLLDRLEQSGRENVEARGLPLYSILTVRDFEGLGK